MDFSGKNILVTGGTNGLGLEIARILTAGGATVYAFGRSQKTPVTGPGKYIFVQADFARLTEIKDRVSELTGNGVLFDAVICNAGVLSPPDFQLTTDGFEYTFQVNFLSHLVVNELLLNKNALAANAGIMVTTSPVYKYFRPSFELPSPDLYKPFRVYSDSKYYTLLIGEFFRKRYPGSDFIFTGFDPGTFSSGIYRMQAGWFHAVYRAGSYFMRGPAKVAAAAVMSLSDEKKAFNTVYSVRGGMRKFIPSEPGRAADFTDKCFESLRIRSS
jgi:NAD(P)-dependent dehydrogenase (short-subunit alcohol dehydrogenase family)